ncbi:hypothetical protein [Parasphingorhabdus flavimaris]|uniref:Lipoprotein n=1 Tax=Parasphingorhabdus flavimaris TaxID=266812 RepID=A0ABX2N2G5_9SPHN|nr:hypothetical protein [Parasphingorhabdus flavimaris]NVD27880.1 hypothetical protein [Parasphingorhabdus flavimaris]
MNKKKFQSILFASAAAFIVTGCGADSVASPGEGNIVVLPTPAPTPAPTPTPTPTPTAGTPATDCPVGTANVGVITTGNGEEARNCQVSGVIQGNLVLPKRPNTANTVYSLSGGVEVGVDGGTTGILTIEPGVTIFGSSGGDFLLVNRGSQLFAEGNASAPIIFTSRQNILGQSGVDSIGQWGGIVILGRAPISDCATGGASNPGGARADCEAIVEGPANAVYGGTLPADSSGRLSYVQVRYPGFEVSPGNELNGITMAGVGSGTFFQNIQVHNSSDDGVEWFGGRVNGKNLVMTGIDDDSVDSDSGYKGHNQFVLAVQRVGGGDHVMEADSNGDEDAEPRQDHKLANVTFVSSGGDHVILLRGGGDYAFYNSVFTSRNGGACVDIDSATTIQAAGAGPDENGPPVFESVFLSCPTAFVDDGNVTVAQIQTLFNAGTNNTANGTSTLSNVAAAFPFVNGANETGVTPFAVSGVNSFFEDVNYIGAVRDANDTRFQGWTCGLYANDCATAPTIG